MKLSGLRRWRGGRAVPGMPLTGMAVPPRCPETWGTRERCATRWASLGAGFRGKYRNKQGSKGACFELAMLEESRGKGGSLRPYNPSSPPCSPGAAWQLPAVQGGDAAPRWGLGAVTQGWDMQHGMSPVALALSADALLCCHRPAGPRCTGSRAHTNPALLLTASSFGRGEAEPLPPHATFFFVFFF